MSPSLAHTAPRRLPLRPRHTPVAPEQQRLPHPSWQLERAENGEAPISVEDFWRRLGM